MKPECKTYPDGTQAWYLNGKRHREDGPAIIYPNGYKEWWLNDNLHREDGPAVIDSDGTQEWWLYGKRHREDGPAIIYPNGTQYWYLNGKYHREDGPAIIYPDGSQYWFLNGNDITSEVVDWAKERNIDLNNMCDMDKLVLKLEMKMWAKQLNITNNIKEFVYDEYY